MKLKIIQKLFIVASLPIFTLLLYSLAHIDSKYINLQQNKVNASKINIMRYTSNLLHQLQVERGASMSVLHNVNDSYFLPLLKLQKIKTDKALVQFQDSMRLLDAKNISISSKKYMKTLENSLNILDITRESVLSENFEHKTIFKQYTLINTQLLSLFNSFILTSNSKKITSEITALYSLLRYQEYAGQERALVSRLSISDSISTKEMQRYHNLLNSQMDESNTIRFLLENHSSASIIYKINSQYKSGDFANARNEILNHELEKNLLSKISKTIGFGGLLYLMHNYQTNQNEESYLEFLQKRKLFDTLMIKYMKLSNKQDHAYKVSLELKNYFKNISKDTKTTLNDAKILSLFNILDKHHITLDSKLWFDTSTQRIDFMHEAEEILFSSILVAINEDVEKDNDLLQNQIILTALTIFTLLFGTFHIARKIKNSILTLEKGINDFFDFLNAKIKNPKIINIQSRDEINDMAQNINTQIKIIQTNLEEDEDFIDETTQIVMLMKEGNFSEKPYFIPHNPHLIELKNVFNQLTDLLSDKIKEQTDSLEELNSSLEERVHFQTLELEKQIQEITIAMDKAIAAEIAKDEFLANMSHEIRTPLNAILGFVTLLQKEVKEEKNLKYLNIINTSGKSLLTIINDILDFSKIQSGKFIISPYDSNILQELSDTTLLFTSKAYDKNLEYSVYIDPTLPKTINIDTARIKQILSNVLSNAIKFTPNEGSILVTITLKYSQLNISVKDSGIGIAKENLAKVFSAFEQADGSTTRKYGGTGLGLSISYRLAQLMDGKLTLTSQEGVGSIFTLSVPIRIVNNEPQIFIESNKLKDSKIALLSTNMPSQKFDVIKKYLKNFGVTNIIEIQNYKEEDYDLVFFTPNDSYNEKIINSKIPAIALLENVSIKIANLDYIKELYLPVTPPAIIKAINDSRLSTSIKHQEEDQEEAQEEEILFVGSVLVAEDNKTNQMLISLILDDYELEFKIAKNGLEAVDMFKAEKFDLVLMDENMPELNGIGAMQLIKAYEKNKALTPTPILAFTASVLDTDKKMFIDAGMDGFVGKPIDSKELESELSKFLKKKA